MKNISNSQVKTCTSTQRINLRSLITIIIVWTVALPTVSYSRLWKFLWVWIGLAGIACKAYLKLCTEQVVFLFIPLLVLHIDLRDLIISKILSPWCHHQNNGLLNQHQICEVWWIVFPQSILRWVIFLHPFCTICFVLLWINSSKISGLKFYIYARCAIRQQKTHQWRSNEKMLKRPNELRIEAVVNQNHRRKDKCSRKGFKFPFRYFDHVLSFYNLYVFAFMHLNHFCQLEILSKVCSIYWFFFNIESSKL